MANPTTLPAVQQMKGDALGIRGQQAMQQLDEALGQLDPGKLREYGIPTGYLIGAERELARRPLAQLDRLKDARRGLEERCDRLSLQFIKPTGEYSFANYGFDTANYTGGENIEDRVVQVDGKLQTIFVGRTGTNSPYNYRDIGKAVYDIAELRIQQDREKKGWLSKPVSPAESELGAREAHIIVEHKVLDQIEADPALLTQVGRAIKTSRDTGKPFRQIWAALQEKQA
ncbi:Uncharacterised protein [uncultured archaeon]|nr:Uncharacterised protein [uncultured archaeon]